MKTYIFDIDGTLADASHRLHHIQKHPKDWDSFFAAMAQDKPIPHIVGLAQTLHPQILVTGRPERYRFITRDWLHQHDIYGWRDMYMRADGDRRADDEVKRDLLIQLRNNGYEPIMVFDDRDRVVKMWRDNGVPVAQVAYGNF